ncbi:MAG: LLM class flavin-dependent oxidoreductase [Pseudomonadales bacterium]|nr:LLM class flavin-dependent oxidoreductase [Pseudomonadales bacterium]MCP5182457.1 LLM class flavin-dependent oxidoreductase [Pseudomonadales bacterium]
MQFGLILGSPSLTEMIATARRAEDAGFASVWTIEFFNANGLVRLAAVAGATRRIQLGTAIAYAFMRTPMLAASAAMDIDEISGGRMILGLGSGTERMNRDWYSMPWEGAPAPRIRDAIGLVRAAFAAGKGGGLRYEGTHYKVNIPAYTRGGMARDTIPVCLAGVNKGMIRAAAAVADGLICHPVYTRGYLDDVVMPLLSGSNCRPYPYIITAVAEDREQARNEARAQIAFYYTTRLYHAILDVHGWRPIGETVADAFRRGDFAAMARAVPDEMVDAIAIAGTPDEAREQAKRWEKYSDHVILYSPSVGMNRARIQQNLDAIVDTFGLSNNGG